MSEEVPSFTLHWDGPIRPIEAKLGLDDLERLERPGVYACLYEYPEGRLTRVYVGVTGNFRQRLRGHLTATLALTYWLADDRGEYAFEPRVDHLFESAADLERAHRLATAEVGRMRWYNALDDSDPHIPWPAFEGMLIRRVMGLQRDGGRTADGHRIESYNDRGGSVPPAPVVLRNRGAEEIVDILGETVAWPLEPVA